jgi:acetyl-CoA synthetase
MPLSLEGIVAMLACARIGAMHSVVYAGFGATALRDRIEDAGAAGRDRRRHHLPARQTVDLKKILDDAVVGSPRVRTGDRVAARGAGRLAARSTSAIGMRT